MRVQATVNGELENYLKKVAEDRGQSYAAVLVELAYLGLDYRQGLPKLAYFQEALRESNFDTEK